MIAVDLDRCTGCGACLLVCPGSALSLRDGRVSLDAALCRSCDLCLDACPQGALYSMSPMPAKSRQLTSSPVAEVIKVPREPQRSLWRERVLPSLGAVAVVAAQQVLPLVLETLVTRATRREGARAADGPAARLAGRRHRLRGGG